MHPDKRHILWERGDHPSPELLQQYHEGALPEALHHQLERHLLDCSLCADVLEGIAVSDAGQTDAYVRDINRYVALESQPKKRRTIPVYLTDWRVAAALALVLVSTVMVFYYNYQQASEQQEIALTRDQAIQESRDLSEKSEAAAPATVADAVPDTVRPGGIAANTKPLPSPAPRVRVKIPAQAEEVALADHDNLGIGVDFSDFTEAIPEKPVAAPSGKLAEVVVAPQPPQHALVPESTSVAKALQGRVAGVRAGSIATVNMNQIQGQVVGEDGVPLPGVAVVVKGTSTGVATDAQGNFSLTLPQPKATLAFRFIGYETKEKAVEAGTAPITVDMQADKRALSEVVVTGYGKRNSPPAPIIAPKPLEGQRAYRQYLEKNIRYTPDMIRGRVVVRAMVMPNGALESLQVARSLCPSCDDEALRLVAQGPKWEPATQNGQKIAQGVRIVVRFRPEKSK